jgi:hypothetical protein
MATVAAKRIQSLTYVALFSLSLSVVFVTVTYLIREGEPHDNGQEHV